jgi:hypothetical protein
MLFSKLTGTGVTERTAVIVAGLSIFKHLPDAAKQDIAAANPPPLPPPSSSPPPPFLPPTPPPPRPCPQQPPPSFAAHRQNPTPAADKPAHAG